MFHEAFKSFNADHINKLFQVAYKCNPYAKCGCGNPSCKCCAAHAHHFDKFADKLNNHADVIKIYTEAIQNMTQLNNEVAKHNVELFMKNIAQAAQIRDGESFMQHQQQYWQELTSNLAQNTQKMFSIGMKSMADIYATLGQHDACRQEEKCARQNHDQQPHCKDKSSVDACHKEQECHSHEQGCHSHEQGCHPHEHSQHHHCHNS